MSRGRHHSFQNVVLTVLTQIYGDRKKQVVLKDMKNEESEIERSVEKYKDVKQRR